jgi:UDP-N-acetylmuramoylalanine--D-glutamate ligase
MAPRDVRDLTSWHSDWSGLRVVVLGSGITGFAAADTLAELGCTVLVAATMVDDTTAEILGVLGIEFVVGELDDPFPAEVSQFDPDLVIVSPGFTPAHPAVQWANEGGRTVWGDVELAWRLRDKVGPPAEWMLVTGTNGKTTTVQLTAAMLVAGGVRAAPCGNVGVPVLDAIRDPSGFDVLVVELSSFQLHYLGEISPWASVCLNVADDHIDWHGSLEAYRKAKAKVYENTKVACVFNRDDPATREFVEDADVLEGCRAIGFGLGIPGPSDFGVVGEIICDRAFIDDRRDAAAEIVTIPELIPIGLGSRHMVANALAASALARSFGIPVDAVRTALLAFRADQHRSELVATWAGIRWVNDSKATNAHAARASLESFDSLVWIVGGLLKGTSIDALVASAVPRLRGAIVIGNDRAAIVESLARHAPELPVFEVVTPDTNEVMPTAVQLAASIAVNGDTVLLAPAAASMDQFRNYADRGALFVRAVRELLGGGADDDESSAFSTGA